MSESVSAELLEMKSSILVYIYALILMVLVIK